ncbi:MAG: hypothetical protein N2053_10505, partial [Chitinispirillaceae bacterium]|nr:hypothetical protein [Chitinispirillaceae bacterium]
AERSIIHCLGANAKFTYDDINLDIIRKSKIMFIAGTFLMPGFDGEGAEKRKGEALDSIVSGGCIISGGRVIRSVLSRGVRVHSFSVVEDSIIFPDVEIGAKAAVRKAIIERGVKIEPGDRIGFDLEEDRKRFFVTDSGIVVIGQPKRNPLI